MSSVHSNNDNDLLQHWFADFSLFPYAYKEPILQEATVNFIKHLCETLKQDSYVFILAVDVLEDYIQVKQQHNEQIKEEILVIATVILICNKLIGVSLELKVQHIEECIYRITRTRYHPRSILSMEKDIVCTLIGRLPVKSVLDDMNIVIEKYVQETRLKAEIQPLCMRILDYLYITRSKWFYEFKQSYQETAACRNAFKQLSSSKYYLPSGIFLSALQITNYANVLDVDKLANYIANETRIHIDHLNILATKITEIIS